ncbi:hypothetical protein [Calothrix sp. PCC 6303]|uniref:hypothetical protein n=1 Tax=Calothrix sp. PCC 6303 TaxID=1170562 RepID=UPI0002F645C3|nr:hypothetical protein [Calothrix sp. PCC 6303]
MPHNLKTVALGQKIYLQLTEFFLEHYDIKKQVSGADCQEVGTLPVTSPDLRYTEILSIGCGSCHDTIFILI